MEVLLLVIGIGPHTPGKLSLADISGSRDLKPTLVKDYLKRLAKELNLLTCAVGALRRTLQALSDAELAQVFNYPGAHAFSAFLNLVTDDDFVAKRPLKAKPARLVPLFVIVLPAREVADVEEAASTTQLEVLVQPPHAFVARRAVSGIVMQSSRIGIIRNGVDWLSVFVGSLGVDGVNLEQRRS